MTIMKPFSEQIFQNEFVDAFPGDHEPLNFTRKVENILYSEVKPTPVSNPELVAWSDRLGKSLGISKPNEADSVSLALLSGNQTLDSMKSYAARYGGHQFGNWAGQLGDGRAITLSEVLTPAGKMEFQLKGAGPTPYSRRADGRAVLRSSVREFLCSEAMFFLGVPTTRALSLVRTGEEVVRDFFYDGNPKAEPGAIVCRVAPSFIRFGNFEILASNQEFGLLKGLTDQVIAEHFPNHSYVDFLHSVAKRTAVMIAQWMKVGFVHGVMNTDNMSILGLTLDYGPYGWLEPYEPRWTPNTTDAEGRRYSFGNQPGIGLWNIARLAEALGPLIQDQSILEQSLDVFRETFGRIHTRIMSEKLGLLKPELGDEKWVAELFFLMEHSHADYTLFFRALSHWNAASDIMPLLLETFYRTQLSSEIYERWMSWISHYASRLTAEARPTKERLTHMKSVNPKYVLRNYLAQNAIIAAEKGDYSLIDRLMRVLEKPYDDQPAEEDLAKKRPAWAENSPGSSTLSCSS
jgi:uncharacterized protein YdiU (UPF0061 family)